MLLFEPCRKTDSGTAAAGAVGEDGTEALVARPRPQSSLAKARMAMNADSCEATVTTTINIGYFPALEITGDTVVCIGRSDTLRVSCDLPGCTYEWYEQAAAFEQYCLGKTAEELLAALGSHRRITLADGVYYLNTALRLDKYLELSLAAEHPGKAVCLCFRALLRADLPAEDTDVITDLVITD